MLEPTLIGPGGRRQPPRPLLRTMLGEVLRRTRREQGRTLADVAKVARVSMPYLSEVERGRKEASSEVLAAICDSLGIDLSDLLAEIWRDLADLRIRQAQFDRAGRVARLGSAGGERGAPQQRGQAGTPMCLAA
jgi:transcriptional regulator with XRE-family HTH domain